MKTGIERRADIKRRVAEIKAKLNAQNELLQQAREALEFAGKKLGIITALNK